MLYTEIIGKAAEAGGIDCIGTASEICPCAICFSGARVLRKYSDGTKKISLVMQVTGFCENKNQKDIIDRLCAAGEKLSASPPVCEGIFQPEIHVSSLPVPVVHNDRYRIFSSLIEMKFYTKGLI